MHRSMLLLWQLNSDIILWRWQSLFSFLFWLDSNSSTFRLIFDFLNVNFMNKIYFDFFFCFSLWLRKKSKMSERNTNMVKMLNWMWCFKSLTITKAHVLFTPHTCTYILVRFLLISSSPDATWNLIAYFLVGCWMFWSVKHMSCSTKSDKIDFSTFFLSLFPTKLCRMYLQFFLLVFSLLWLWMFWTHSNSRHVQFRQVRSEQKKKKNLNFCVKQMQTRNHLFPYTEI